MKRSVKILIAAVAVLAALVGGWFLTRPAESTAGPVISQRGIAAEPATELLTAPTTVTVTNVIPTDVTWQLSNLVAVPVSASAGPTKTSPEGIRSGFAHSPSGALLAAANWSAGYAQTIPAPETGPALVEQRMMNWPGHAQALAAARDAMTGPAIQSNVVFQIAGFRFLSYDGSHATLLIAKQITQAHQGYADYISLVWADDDWKIIPAVDGNGELGAPCTFPLLPVWTPFAGVA